MQQTKLDRSAVQDIIGLSTMQEGILFHYLSNDSSMLYFSQLCLNLSGQLNKDYFKKAWELVIQNNELLRTVYRWEGVTNPIQIILKEQALLLKEYDLTHLESDARSKRVEEIRGEERQERFDLQTGPLFRITLCKMSNEDWELILNNHHILYDGWSMGVILREFFQGYADLMQGKEPQLLKKNTFNSYLKWLQERDKVEQEKHWRSYLQGITSPTPFPIDHQQRQATLAVQNQLKKLPEGLSDRLRELAKRLNVTVSSILTAAWGILLNKYTNNDQVMFGLSVSGRNSEILEIEEMVGLFINTVPQAIQIDSATTTEELIIRVNQEATQRKGFESASLIDIKSYSEIDQRSELFNSIMVIENFTFFDELNSSDNPLTVNSYHSFEMPNYDLTLEVVLLKEIEVNFIYNNNLIEESTVEKLHTYYANILQEIVKQPDVSPVYFEMFLAEERNQLLNEFNNTYLDYERTKTIHQLFEEQVEKTPNSIALEYEGQYLTYQKLNEQANQLARYLRKRGVQPETIVGIMMERSLEMVIGLIGILKAGGAYLPIDPELPSERINYMLDQANASLLLTNSQSVKGHSFSGLQNFEANDQIKIIATKERGHIKEFGQFLAPDRSLIDLRNYKNKIGMASVNNCISIQTTRGCPYKCLFCHKIWSKHHVHRSAENIFAEIKYYYDRGVTNFAMIDDCFNLDIENSSRLFKMIINHKLNLQIFFPNGLRGDILTPDYIDLMVEAGTRGINLSLETASPRLQDVIKKNLDLDKFKRVVDYIATQHPDIILEMATMHGYPTETEEEAMMTLNFIKDIKWLHFPYIHILKIFPNTEMEEFALEHGIRKEDILKSKDRAFHELPETLPFPKSFTRQYQSEFLNGYFLNKERLRKVLPVQMKIIDESALIQKYNAYLPADIKSIEDILTFAGIEDLALPEIKKTSPADSITIFDRPRRERETKGMMKILLLDLSQHFSSHSMLYKVVEQPLGLIYLQTYLNQRFGERVDGRVYKSGNDFDSYSELKAIIDDYQPDLIGIRTLTFFKDFFHQTVSMIRQWGVKAPILAGGPYASSDFDTILKDQNVNLVVRGEGEYTMGELVEHILDNNYQLPSPEILSTIEGVIYADPASIGSLDHAREVIYLDQMSEIIAEEEKMNLTPITTSDHLAYVMYTSGTTGKPKGIMIEHKSVNNCIFWMQDEFTLSERDIVVQRTNLTFDPSVWELFWPLYRGGKVKLLTTEQSRDAEYLVNLLSTNEELTMMYVPASLLAGMTYLMQSKGFTGRLKLPYLLIGAEPIRMDVVKKFYNYFEGLIVNTYGPTEATINNTYYYLDRDDLREIVPIGKPVANNQIYILTKEMQLVPIHQQGEICIAGGSLARGYINNQEATDQVFVSNPYGDGKLYKTGDLGRWLEDGNIEIMGRIDHQVKIRGYRIEPGEIESSLLQHPEIQNCVVMVRDRKEDSKEEVCKSCGITTAYPGIELSEDQICNTCRDGETYLEVANRDYFKGLDDLKKLVQEKSGDSEYDCLVLYAGGKGAAYALYQLVDMGLKVLACTYDNGYFSPMDLKRIKTITKKLGVDHIFLTHDKTDAILKESLQSAATVCHGCFLTSSSLAVGYASKNNIKVVIGATLSRGQIMENKLYKFYRSGIFDTITIENELKKIQRQSYGLDEKIFGLIDIDGIEDGSIYDQVSSIDFYRYCDVSNEEMLNYLVNRDPYWKKRKNYAVYSTNCPLKQIGDYYHLQNKGFHYYGGATSWEKRLGHIILENIQDDLAVRASKKSLENFMKMIGMEKDHLVEMIETKYIAAYYESNDEVELSELKEHLLKNVPDYMLPTSYLWMKKLPLDHNGKIDRKKLPKPSALVELSSEYVAPRNELEEKLVDIWKTILGIEQVGIKDSFFNLGGNSLSIIKLTEEVNKLLENEIKITDFFANYTIELFMEFYEREFGHRLSPDEEVDQILERFNRGEITMEEADQLIEGVVQG